MNSIPSTPVALLALTAPTTVKICFEDNLPDEENQLTFTMIIGISATKTQVLFDYLEYQPTFSAAPQLQSFVGISADDPSIVYSTSNPLNWGNISDPFGPGVPGTEASFNSSIEYNFTG